MVKRVTQFIGLPLLAIALVFFLTLRAAASDAGAAPSPQVKTGFVEVEGGKLYYERAGEGENVVLIHDGMLHSAVWDEQFARFARHFAVIRYDRRGYGRSSKPLAPYSSLDDLIALFDALKLDRAAVCGMSAGGGLAIDFTLAHPERVTALVLVGAVVGGFPYTEHFITRGGRMRPGASPDADSVYRYFAEKDPWEIAPQNLEAHAKVLRLVTENPPQEDRQIKMPASPALPRLGEIKARTLVIAGESDIPDVHAHAGAIAAGIPKARRAVVVNSGHLVPLEQPVAFDRVTLPFLMGLEPFSIADARSAAAFSAMAGKLRQKEPDLTLFGEAEINAAGYAQLQADRPEAAVALFKLNVEDYPESWNAYDSLGEALLKAGDMAAAQKMYEKSVSLKPDSKSGIEALQRIRSATKAK
jgi:3-oxoadipate enol-lactonase